MAHKSLYKRRLYQRKYQRIWREENRKKVRLIQRKYYRGHRVEKLKQTVIQNRLRYHKYRILALEKYGGKPPKCACCGERNYEFLTIDHINGEGGKHRRSLNGYTGGLYRWLVDQRKMPKQYQVLCMNCNCAKFRYEICPHQKRKS